MADENERAKLWEEYSRKPSTELRDRLIVEYADLVKVVAGRMSMYLGRNVEYDDLVGYGVFGLIESVDRFNPTKNVKFETFASQRIRGAILDQIRKLDWLPRSVRQKQKNYETAKSELASSLGRTPTADELAKKMGLTVDEIAGLEADTELSSLVSLDDYLEQGSEVGNDEARGNSDHGIVSYESPETKVEKEELKQTIVDAINELTEKEKTVISLYYYDEMNLREISNIMSVSESRVSQLHSKALVKLKNKLGDYVDTFTKHI